MAKRNDQPTRWIVVKTWRGLIAEVRVYRTFRGARTRERQFRATMDPAYDEVGVFRAGLSSGRVRPEQLADK
jgi:hypothetical protein